MPPDAPANVHVSVVIPTRDRLAYLQEAVASVRAQTFAGWELLIVDDASEDGTPDWLGGIEDPRIRVLRLDRNVHRAAARNRGLQSTVGEYVIFLDDDDRFRTRALEVLIEPLRNHRDLVAACGARIEFDDHGYRKRIPHVRRPHRRELWPVVLGGWVAGTGQVMFRTEDLRSIGGWDERLTAAQDWDLLLRASRRFGPMYLHPAIVRERRMHPGQWLPHDHENALSVLERSFLASLPPRERAVGEGAVRMRALLEQAHKQLHAKGEPGEALRLFVAAYRSAPAVARSPMFRVWYLRGLTQAFLARVGGRHVNRLLESIRREVRRRLRGAHAQGPGPRIDEAPMIQGDGPDR